MPELERSPGIVKTPDTEKLSPPSSKRGGVWRRVTTTLTAVALAAACTSPAPPRDKVKPIFQPPSGEAVQETKLPSVTETINQLKTDTSLSKSDVIDTTALKNHFSPEDYTKSPYNEEKSAPVLEVVYDNKDQTLRFKDQTPKGLQKESLYQVLIPIVNNEVILKAAFEKGDLLRVVLRQQPYNKLDIEHNSIEVENYSYQPEDKTLYVYLPGEMPTISQQKVTDTFRHETVHSLTTRHPLSEGGTKPNKQDLRQWAKTCQAIRNIAVDEAEKDKQDILQTMRNGRTLFTDPKIRATFDEVYQALRNGTFNNLQPKASDTVANFSAEVPECRTIGPWQSFIRLLTKKGIDTKAIASDQINKLSYKIDDDWNDIIKNNTIFTQLTETSYQREGTLGHPYDNWDELITSTSNILIAYPETLAINLNKLDPKQRASARNLIQLATIDLLSQIPREEKFNAFNKQVLDAKQRFDSVLIS